jgi:lipopolysaccharide transport system ATP-binding protein
MAAVENLCSRCIVMESGRVAYTGAPRDAIREYLKAPDALAVSLRERVDRIGVGGLRLTDVELRDRDGNPLDVASSGSDVEVWLGYEMETGASPTNVIASLQLRTQFDVPVFLQHNRLVGVEFDRLPRRGAFICSLPNLPLAPSIYRVSCSVQGNGEMLDLVEEAATITVVAGDFFASGEVPPDTHGCALVRANWEVREIQR